MPELGVGAAGGEGAGEAAEQLVDDLQKAEGELVLGVSSMMELDR